MGLVVPVWSRWRLCLILGIEYVGCDWKLKCVLVCVMEHEFLEETVGGFKVVSDLCWMFLLVTSGCNPVSLYISRCSILFDYFTCWILINTV